VTARQRAPRTRLSSALIVVALAALAALGAAACAGAPSSRRPARIIDVHLHAYTADRFEVVGAPNPVTGKPSRATTDEALLQEALAAMERHRIVKAVATGWRTTVERWRQAAPDRFIGGIGLEDGKLPDLATLREDVRAGRIAVLGELGLQYYGKTLADPELEPYLALAEELGLPVAVHTGLGPPRAPYHASPRFRTAFGNPQLLEEVLVRHPRLRIYLMHAGWPYLAETVAIMSVYPQVHLDLAVINWIIPRAEFHAYLHALMRAGFGKRLMFGSDQMIWPEAIALAIEGVASAPFLDEAELADVFYGNAARFLGLE
jgi:predicted TIM-barrel fold metal-dependent hydrolase